MASTRKCKYTLQSVDKSLRAEPRSSPNFACASPTRLGNTTPSMPQRAPLTPISGNSTRRKELTPIQRAEICTAFEWGGAIPEIAKRFKVPESTIRETIKKATTTSRLVDLVHRRSILFVTNATYYVSQEKIQSTRINNSKNTQSSISQRKPYTDFSDAMA